VLDWTNSYYLVSRKSPYLYCVHILLIFSFGLTALWTQLFPLLCPTCFVYIPSWFSNALTRVRNKLFDWYSLVLVYFIASFASRMNATALRKCQFTCDALQSIRHCAIATTRLIYLDMASWIIIFRYRNVFIVATQSTRIYSALGSRFRA